MNDFSYTVIIYFRHIEILNYQGFEFNANATKLQNYKFNNILLYSSKAFKVHCSNKNLAMLCRFFWINKNFCC